MHFIWNSLTFLIWLNFKELCLFKIKETDIILVTEITIVYWIWNKISKKPNIFY